MKLLGRWAIACALAGLAYARGSFALARVGASSIWFYALGIAFSGLVTFQVLAPGAGLRRGVDRRDDEELEALVHHHP